MMSCWRRDGFAGTGATSLVRRVSAGAYRIALRPVVIRMRPSIASTNTPLLLVKLAGLLMRRRRPAGGAAASSIAALASRA